jgi:hypothetical protein
MSGCEVAWSRMALRQHTCTSTNSLFLRSLTFVYFLGKVLAMEESLESEHSGSTPCTVSWHADRQKERA